MKIAPWTFLTCLLIGCKGYDVSVNDRVVYTPKPLLSDYAVEDRNLDVCLAQTIKDHKVTQVAELTRLRCTHAGIETLAGLQKFYALTELDLSDNKITDITAVANLGKLRTLILENNAIENTAPLLNLINLADLNLAGNPAAGCADLLQLETSIDENRGKTSLPEHCQ